MPGKLPVLRPRDVLRALQRAGFFIHHQTGRHARLLHSTRSDLRVTIPIHPGDLPPSLLKRILKQADITEENFRKLL
jgi:predicted RNA binding protein YcfA (HicA-like mRNA interferase family)